MLIQRMIVITDTYTVLKFTKQIQNRYIKYFLVRYVALSNFPLGATRDRRALPSWVLDLWSTRCYRNYILISIYIRVLWGISKFSFVFTIKLYALYRYSPGVKVFFEECRRRRQH